MATVVIDALIRMRATCARLSPAPGHLLTGARARRREAAHRLHQRGGMAIAAWERMLDDWPMAWSSNGSEKALALVVDDCLFEDVTFGVVSRGKAELRSFANGRIAAVAAPLSRSADPPFSAREERAKEGQSDGQRQ